MKKRIFSVLLALCLALALVPASALAADADGFTINQNGVLTKYTGTSTDVVIPEGVTEIGSNVFKGLPLTSVTCPSSLLKIGSSAFEGCRTLTNVTLSGGLVEIGGNAFQNCIGLKSIIIYDGVKKIGVQAFRGCISLKSATIPASVTTIDTYAFFNDISLEDVYYGGSEMQWNSISFPRGVNGNGNGNLFAAKLHLNSPMPDPPTPTTVPDPTPTPPPVPAPAPDDPKPGTDPAPSTAVKVTGVTLSQSTLTMAVGDTDTLTATVAPDNADNRAVTWSSSDNSIATVDSNGLVIAISPGLAVMRATTADGGFTTQCRVTVEEKKTEDPSPAPGTGSGTAAPSNVHFPRANVYHQGQFTDVSADQWYTQSVADAFELGLMKGNSTTTFNVNGNVTIAEAVTMASRIHCIYTNGSDTIVPQSGPAWYQVYLDYAYRNHIISDAYYNSDVTQIATRAQFAEIFVNSLPEEGLSPINNISDGKVPDVPMSAPYAAAVYRLYRAGILSGNDATGTFSPFSFISRVEAAALVSRMAEANSRKAFTL